MKRRFSSRCHCDARSLFLSPTVCPSVHWSSVGGGTYKVRLARFALKGSDHRFLYKCQVTAEDRDQPALRINPVREVDLSGSDGSLPAPLSETVNHGRMEVDHEENT